MLGEPSPDYVGLEATSAASSGKETDLYTFPQFGRPGSLKSPMPTLVPAPAPTPVPALRLGARLCAYPVLYLAPPTFLETLKKV